MIDVNFDFTTDTPDYWHGYWDRIMVWAAAGNTIRITIVLNFWNIARKSGAVICPMGAHEVTPPRTS